MRVQTANDLLSVNQNDKAPAEGREAKCGFGNWNRNQTVLYQQLCSTQHKAVKFSLHEEANSSCF